MRLPPLHAAALAAVLVVPAIVLPAIVLPTTCAAAQPRLRPVVAPHRAVHHRHGRTIAGRAPAPYGYIDSVPEDPRYGYEEAPYDPNYQGPGAEVFAATKAQARASGLLHELAPDAKVSATGIVVGGGL